MWQYRTIGLLALLLAACVHAQGKLLLSCSINLSLSLTGLMPYTNNIFSVIIFIVLIKKCAFVVKKRNALQEYIKETLNIGTYYYYYYYVFSHPNVKNSYIFYFSFIIQRRGLNILFCITSKRKFLNSKIIK